LNNMKKAMRISISTALAVFFIKEKQHD